MYQIEKIIQIIFKIPLCYSYCLLIVFVVSNILKYHGDIYIYICPIIINNNFQNHLFHFFLKKYYYNIYIYISVINNYLFELFIPLLHYSLSDIRN